MNLLKTNKGQSLIEYLIIVALVAVAAIGMVKAVGANVSIHFANIAKALSGEPQDAISTLKVKSKQARPHDLGDYMEGASGPSK